MQGENYARQYSVIVYFCKFLISNGYKNIYYENKRFKITNNYKPVIFNDEEIIVLFESIIPKNLQAKNIIKLTTLIQFYLDLFTLVV